MELLLIFSVCFVLTALSVRAQERSNARRFTWYHMASVVIRTFCSEDGFRLIPIIFIKHIPQNNTAFGLF